MRSGARFLAAALALSGLACGEDRVSSATGPGVLEVVLTTPSSDDGAILFQVDGTVDSMIAAPGYSGFSNVSPGFTRAVVTGSVSGGIIARLYIPDVSAAGQYSATLLQAAARNSFALQPVTGYALTLRHGR
jgi:hypothetical protein